MRNKTQFLKQPYPFNLPLHVFSCSFIMSLHQKRSTVSVDLAKKLRHNHIYGTSYAIQMSKYISLQCTVLKAF